MLGNFLKKMTNFFLVRLTCFFVRTRGGGSGSVQIDLDKLCERLGNQKKTLEFGELAVVRGA
jgi:hypothetical protein